MNEFTTTSSPTTKKGLIDRVRDKIGIAKSTTIMPAISTETPTRGFFGRLYDKVKNALQGNAGTQESPVKKYGMKAVKWLGPKVLKKIRENFHSAFYSTDEEFPTQLQNFEDHTLTDIKVLKEKVGRLEKLIQGLQSVIMGEWNTTESGSKYKLFEERRNWDDAEKKCQSFGAHLAVIDNEAKNNYVKSLLDDSQTADYAWIGMKTKTTSQTTSFTNFASENPIDGCAVLDKKGIWTIRSPGYSNIRDPGAAAPSNKQTLKQIYLSVLERKRESFKAARNRGFKRLFQTYKNKEEVETHQYDVKIGDRMIPVFKHTQMQDLNYIVDAFVKEVERIQQIVINTWNTTDSGSKYKLFDEPKTFESAEQHCASFGAYLAIIDNSAKNDFVTKLLEESHKSVEDAWIGQRMTNGKSVARDEECTVIDRSGNSKASKACLQKLPFICQVIKVASEVIIEKSPN
ncbi:unnamed protein product [Caenorhabditis bovis]|uniref:C-type lectin domain-containing protein n=1 Tax=Caenorhabditis bovis TaxID=2654633 RepID=A0A8S1ET08_9PELO|nr:unnamed protein product [Caenorhabditis bovis]